MPVSIHAFWRWLEFVIIISIMFPTQTIASEVSSFDIESGDAELTLKKFAKQAERGIVYKPENVSGVQTNKVVGVLSPNDALERMLMGTPLCFKQDLESGVYAVTRFEGSIVKHTSDKTEPENKEGKEMTNPKNSLFRKVATAVLLGVVGGQGQTAVLGQDGTRTEEDEEIHTLGEFEIPAEEIRGWVSPYSTAATKAATKLVDIPQPVTVLTREFLEDIGSIDENDVIQMATPGVVLRTNANMHVNIRGIEAINSSIDGVASRVVYNYPSILFESIEVVKGPASLLYGAFADGGGFINRVSKDPKHEFGGFLQGRVGTNDMYQFAFDVTGPLAAFDGNVQYRVIAEIVDREYIAGYSDTYDKHHVVSVEFAFDLGKTNRLKIGYWYNDRDIGGGDRGVIDPTTAPDDSSASLENPVSSGLPIRGFTYGAAFSEFDDYPAIMHSQANVLDVTYTSNPFPGFSFRSKFVWEHRQQSGNLFSGTGNFLSDSYNTVFSGNDDDFEILNGQMDGIWTYRHSENFENRLIMGVEVSYLNGSFTRAVGGGAIVGGLEPLDLDNPSAYLDQPLPELNWSDTGESDELVGGFFIADRLSFWRGKIQFNAGIRYNWIGAARLFIPTPTGEKGDFLTDPETGETIPNFNYDEFQRHFEKDSYVSTPWGILVKPIDQLSFYYSYSDSFKSNGSNTLTFDGTRAGPQISEGTEYGVKFDFLKGLSGTISIFDIDVTNRIAPDTINPGYRIILDPINNSGWEMSLSYTWKNLTIMGGYYSGDIKDIATGVQVNTTNNGSANLAARYQISEGSLAGLAFGGNYSWTDEMFVSNGLRRAPSYELVDVWINYRWGDWKFQVAGKNIFDTNYSRRYVRPSFTLVAPGEIWQFSVTRYFGSRSSK